MGINIVCLVRINWGTQFIICIGNFIICILHTLLYIYCMFCFKTMANPILWQGKELTEGTLGKGGAFHSCRRSCTRIGKSRRRPSVWHVNPLSPPSPYVAFSFLYASVPFHWLSHTANCACFGFSTALDQSHGILSPSMPPSQHPSLPPPTLRISWEVALDRGNTHVRWRCPPDMEHGYLRARGWDLEGFPLEVCGQAGSAVALNPSSFHLFLFSSLI